MSPETLKFIHDCYQKALEESENILQVTENLYAYLIDAEVSEEDSTSFDLFIDGLRNCLRIRRMTPDITDIVTNISITILHIFRWLNQTNGLNIDVFLLGRRKSLESDLTKLLRKSTQTMSANIRDRFGLRLIVSDDNESYIYQIYEAIVGILAAKNRKLRKEFVDWVKTSGSVNLFTVGIIELILQIPFDLDRYGYKDYIESPKPNGYQSLHFTLTVQPYSMVIPGVQLEVQLRTDTMNSIAETGTASFEEYKKYADEDPNNADNPLLKVFVVDDFSKINIRGFTSYKSENDDKDGMHFPKRFANRRISDLLDPSDSRMLL